MVENSSALAKDKNTKTISNQQNTSVTALLQDS